jgi:hypothetical protein
MMDRRSFVATLAAGLAPGVAVPDSVELRAYRTQPGQRDALVAMFERQFLDAYERGGARILGSFTTPDDADRWVWLRAFPDPEARREALERFYASPEWLAGREACNATIADTGDAWLLRPVTDTATPDETGSRFASGAGSVLLELYRPSMRESRQFLADYLAQAEPLLRGLGAPQAWHAIEDRRTNRYPRQRLRGGAVLVVLTRFADAGARAEHLAQRRAASTWMRRVRPRLLRQLRVAPWVLRLDPTPRFQASGLRC